ncbi:MAG: hypothetical protein U1E51_07250 [Candidatus Binatia bacterium]|nr:hypothetical protein [Candidatus Binatia bacterium]
MYDAPPRWGEHWGARWESSRRGWDRCDRKRVYAPAPLPLYQKKYERDRYPAFSEQVAIHNEQYRYQPQDVHVREQQTTIFQRQSQGGAKAPGKAERVVASPKGQEKAQRQEKAQPQEKYQPQEKAQRQEKAQHQEKESKEEKKAKKEGLDSKGKSTETKEEKIESR